MRWLAGLVSAIVVLGLLPGANAQAPPHPGTLGVGDLTAMYVGEASARVQMDEDLGGGCAIHAQYSWAATKLDDLGGRAFGLGELHSHYASGESGNGSYVQDPCNDDPGCSTGLTKWFKSGPGYVNFQQDGSSVKATVDTFTWTATDNACGGDVPIEASAVRLTGSIPISAVGSPTITVQLSPGASGGGLTRSGSGTLTLHRVEHELRLEEQAAEAVTVPLPVRFRARTFPPWATATRYEWQMKRSHSSRWTTLRTTTTKTFEHTLKLAGHFKWRVILYNFRAIGFRTVPIQYGPAEPLEVRFPTQDQIINNQTVRSFTLDAWLLTLDYATQQSRREVGYWIKLNTCTGSYGHTTRIEGPTRGPYEPDAEVILGPRPADTPSPPPEVKGCATYTVASFHTHPPTTYQKPLGDTRPVGPSPADQSLDRRDKVAGIVFDYIADPPGTRRIPYGHPKHKPAFLYRSGLVRRPTPP